MAEGKLNATVLILAVVAAAAIAVAATLWATRGSASVTQPPATPPASAVQDPVPRSAAVPGPPVITGMGASVSSTDAPAALPSAGTGVIVNGRELTASQLEGLRQAYGAVPPRGTYWYDSRSGLYGYWGYEAAGYIRPGHDFGPLSVRASNGNTGIFLNGREINLTEALFFKSVFGVVYTGYFWLDGTTGFLGVQGNPTPLVSLPAAMQAAQRRQGEYHWRDGSGGVVSSSGNCTFAAIPGAPVYSTPGCG